MAACECINCLHESTVLKSEFKNMSSVRIAGPIEGNDGGANSLIIIVDEEP